MTRGDTRQTWSDRRSGWHPANRCRFLSAGARKATTIAAALPPLTPGEAVRRNAPNPPRAPPSGPIGVPLYRASHALSASTSPDQRGLDGTGRAAQHAGPRSPRRRPGLPPLLGRRAPRRRDARRTGPGGADRPDRRGHQDDPLGSGGVMLPHYSPLKVAEAFACSPASFPAGSTSGSAVRRARIRDHSTRSSATAARPRPTTSRAARGAARPPEGTLPPDHPSARYAATLPGRPGSRSRGCLAPRRRADLGPAARAPVRLRRPSTARARASPRTTSATSTPGGDAAPRTIGRGVALAADTEQEAWELTASSRMAMAIPRRGRLIPVPPVSRRCASSRRRARRPAAPAGSPPARPSRSARVSRSSRSSTARTS